MVSFALYMLAFTSLNCQETAITKSAAPISYHLIKIKKGDSFFKLFGRDWKLVADFNRLDEKHLVIGKKIKVPDKIEDLKNWSPLPKKYKPAKIRAKYILVNLTEQFLGFYRDGILIFDAPISSGQPPEKCDAENKDCSTPVGLFRVLGGDKGHTSSLYDDPQGNPYPMTWAVRFHVAKTGIQYWIHRGDLPGFPASHGCIRLKEKEAKILFHLVFKKYPEDEFWINPKKVYIPVEIQP